MNGIDVSNYQRGLDLSKVPCDFMICKATEGTTIVHDTCDPFVQQAIALGKKWGFYHFGAGGDAIAEADYFYANTKNYFGHGIPVLDYEMYGAVGADWAKRFMDRIYELTGVRCIIYMSRSVCTSDDWSEVAKDYALWVAQYANNDETGYQDSPWFSGSIGAFPSVAIHQYSSHGRLDGYDGNLDLDIAYMTPEAWDRFANPSGAATDTPAPAPEPTPATPEGSVLDLVCQIIDGGINGDDRRAFLGTRYDEVQSFIQHIYDASTDELAAEVWEGRYGNNPQRSKVLDIAGRAEEVQAAVNGKAAAATRSYTVQSGDTLSGIAQKVGWGGDYMGLARKNGISNPNVIYPGQVINY